MPRSPALFQPWIRRQRVATGERELFQAVNAATAILLRSRRRTLHTVQVNRLASLPGTLSEII